MIVITVDLVSARGRQYDKRLGKMIVANDGTGTEMLRNYVVRTMRGRDAAALDKNVVQRSGKVTGHPSARLHIWHLISRALQSVGYTGDHRRTPELRADEIAEFLRWKATRPPHSALPDELDTTEAQDERV